MRGWRHDYHNHIQTLLALCGDEEKTRRYLLDLSDELKTVDTVIKTGNVMLDAILGSKLSLIKAKLIAVNAKAVVPEKLSVSELDLCNVVGNLLDNAAESCAGSDKPWIRVFIGALKDNCTFPCPTPPSARRRAPARRMLRRRARGTASVSRGSTKSPRSITATQISGAKRECLRRK